VKWGGAGSGEAGVRGDGEYWHRRDLAAGLGSVAHGSAQTLACYAGEAAGKCMTGLTLSTSFTLFDDTLLQSS
jgi:hypothetical protein